MTFKITLKSSNEKYKVSKHTRTGINMSQHLIYAIYYNFETPQLSTVQDIDRHMFKRDFLSIVNNTLLFYILYILAICFDL